MHIREDIIHFLLLKIAMNATPPPTQKKKTKDFGNVLLDIFVGDDDMVKNYLTQWIVFSLMEFFSDNQTTWISKPLCRIC